MAFPLILKSPESRVQSPEYGEYDVDLQKTMVIADRILAACSGDLRHASLVRKIVPGLELLENAFDNKSDLVQAAMGLGDQIEIWLKAAVWLAHPEGFEKQDRKMRDGLESGERSKFNLGSVLLQLDLLTDNEIKPNHNCFEVGDVVRQAVCVFYHKIFHQSKHDGSELDYQIRQRCVTDILVTLIAPVVRYRKQLENTLGNLIVSPVEFGRLECPRLVT